MKKLSFLFLASLGGTASANAFLINEFDARAVGRGDAVAAIDTDPSSIYFNVGGLAGAEGTGVLVTAAVVGPFASFTENGTGETFKTSTAPQAIPSVFATTRINDMVAVGIGVSSPFGLSGTWPENAPTNDVVRKESLRTFFITPAIGLNLSRYVPGLTIGGGVDFVPAQVDLQQDIFFGQDIGTAHLGASAFGIGGRVGAMYKPEALPELSVGAMWRSNVKERFDGTGDFDAPVVYRPALPPDGPVTTTITLPQSVTAGAAYRPLEGLELEGDVVWANWSTFKSLDINVPASMGTGVMTISQPQDYSNTWTVRAGVEYKLPHYDAALRAGYIFDQTPVPITTLNVTVPDHDRHDISAGGTIWFGNYVVHLAGLYVIPAGRATSDVPFMPEHKGVYDFSAYVVTASFGGRFSSLSR